MSKGYDEKIKPEVIILSDLKNYDIKECEYEYEEEYEYNYEYKYYISWRMQLKKENENPNKSKEEIEREVKEEIKNNINLLKKENTKYYQIDDNKNKELEKIFNQIKLKVNFNSEPRILRNGKFYTISQGYFTMYSDKFYKKLFEIKFEENDKISSAIELDNNDIVFFSKEQLIIYRLTNEKYSLLQKIDENRTGYYLQMDYSGCTNFPKTYYPLLIKEISGNRFICVSNYGFKIYGLNEKNKYSVVLLKIYYDSIKKIYELDKDSFIFCSKIFYDASLGGPGYNEFVFDKIQLKEISQNEKNEKLNEIKERLNNNYYLDKLYEEQDKKNNEIEVKNLIESLKYSCNYNEFFEISTRGEHHYFSGEIILKNKYLLVGVDHNILLFDIYSGKQLKRYEILIEGTDNLYKQMAYIEKWNNDEFFMNIYSNIFLFRLTDENDLKIIANSYFKNINNVKKLDENNNIYYNDDNMKSVSIFY